MEDVVKQAHRYGLLVDAYIGKTTDRHIFGLCADTSEEVRTTAKQMESIGVDMIGLMTGMSYNGVASGEIHPEIRERLLALVESVKVPTLAEGGINTDNFKAFKKTGVQILVVEKRKKLILPGSSVEYNILAPTPAPANSMEFLLLLLPPGESESSMFRHDGTEYFYVQEGEIVFSINNTDYILNEGDSGCFDSSVPHYVRNESTKTAKILIVGSEQYL